MPPTPSWPQSKGQIEECPVPSRTHYTRAETDREQRSLCDSAGLRQTDRHDGGGGREGESSFSRWLKGIKSANKEREREEMREVSLMKQPLETGTDRPLAMLFSNFISNVSQRHTLSHAFMHHDAQSQATTLNIWTVKCFISQQENKWLGRITGYSKTCLVILKH